MEGNSGQISSEGIKEIFFVPCIGELSARILVREGFDSLYKLKETNVEDLNKLPKIGEILSNRIKIELDENKTDPDADKREIICPSCDCITPISKHSCPECGTGFSINDDEVVLPGGRIVKDPLSHLAELDIKLIEGEEDEEIWYAKASILENMGFLEMAYKAYDKVIEFDPLYDQIWNAKARLAMKLGRLDEAARAYKVSVDFRTHATPEIVQEIEKESTHAEEEFKTAVKEHLVAVEEVEEKLGKARQIVTHITCGSLDLSFLDELLNRAVKARNEDAREDAIEFAEDIIKRGELITDLDPLVCKIEEKLFSLDEGYDKHETYFVAFSDMMDMLSGDGFGATLDEARKQLEDLKKAPQKEFTKEEFKERFEGAKSKFAQAQDTKISMDPIKEQIRTAIAFGKEEDYTHGVKLVDDIIKNIDKVNEIFNMIVKGKEKILTIKDAGMDYDHYLNELKHARDTAEKGNYDSAIKVLDFAMTEMDKELSNQKTDAHDEELETEEIVDEPVPQETEEDDQDYQRKFDEMKKGFVEIRTGPVNATHIGSRIKRILDSKKKKGIKAVTNDIDTVIDDINKIKTIGSMLEDSYAKLEELKRSEADTSLFTREFTAAKNKADAGEYDSSIELFKQLLIESEDVSQDEQQDEVQDNNIMENGSLSEGKEVSQDEVKDGVRDVGGVNELMLKFKELVITARNMDIDVGESGPTMNSAVKSMKEGDDPSAVEYLNKGLSSLRSKIDEKLQESIKEVESLLDKMEEGEAASEAQRYLQEAKDVMDDDSKEAFQLLAKAKIKGEEAKGQTAKAEDTISSMERFIKDSIEMGLDIGSALEKIGEAKQYLTEDDLESALKSVDGARKEAFQGINAKISSVLIEAQEELKKARLSGINVSKPIYLLKEVKKAHNGGDLEASIVYLKKYNEELDSLR